MSAVVKLWCSMCCRWADHDTSACPLLPSTHSLQRVVGAHAFDCTIYSALINGTHLDGICTCGYGWECVRRSDWDKMFSPEWLEANKRPNAEIRRGGEGATNQQSDSPSPASNG